MDTIGVSTFIERTALPAPRGDDFLLPAPVIQRGLNLRDENLYHITLDFITRVPTNAIRERINRQIPNKRYFARLIKQTQWIGRFSDINLKQRGQRVYIFSPE